MSSSPPVAIDEIVVVFVAQSLLEESFEKALIYQCRSNLSTWQIVLAVLHSRSLG